MKLDSEFYRLPLRFDAVRLADEVAAMDEKYWRCFDRANGMAHVPLVAVQGDADTRNPCGAMQPTSALVQHAFLPQMLGAFRTPLGRTSLIRIDANATTQRYVDADDHWMHRLCIFIGVTASPDARFVVGDHSIHIPAGESWVLDTWRGYQVVNAADEPSVYAVLETVGSSIVWELLAQAERPTEAQRKTRMTTHVVEYTQDHDAELEFENIQRPDVMGPWEQACLVRFLFDELAEHEANSRETISKLRLAIRDFCRNWCSLWARYGEDLGGGQHYQRAIRTVEAAIGPFATQLVLGNSQDAVDFIRHAILRPALRQGELADDDAAALQRASQGTEENLMVAVAQAAAETPTVNPSRDAQMHIDSAPTAQQLPDSAASPLRSVHTTNLPQLFNEAGISLLISTYQAGRLILARNDEGTLNTHFRNFAMPMGLACDGHRLAIGTKMAVWEFRNQPEVSRLLEPPNKHDACYLPRGCHVTGNIAIHEIAFAEKELWIVNTRFSCLCTLDRDHSFVPHWRPPFVSGLAAEDRCHLNGLAIVDARPKFATALGMTDTPQGWRANKAFGGVLLDVVSGEVIAQGLSMPHSPRFYDGKLWVLESGAGSLSTVDLDTGKLEHIALLPGFTRGIDFVGPYAFVGLSQVRESAVFSGIPITERGEELVCGVWVVDTRNGQTVGFLRFEDGVQEIFAVQVVRNCRFPELLNDGDNEEIVGNSWIVPDEALKDVQIRR